MYLETFVLPDQNAEDTFIFGLKRTCYTSCYPFRLFPERGLARISFAPITLFYGGNGSGKTTLLHIIAEALQLKQGAPLNRSAFFGDYVSRCRYERRQPIPEESRLITSDDVFDYLQDIRCLNESIDRKREDLFREYTEAKYSQVRMRSLDDYADLKKQTDARRLTQSAFVRDRLMQNTPECSNGESAYRFFTDAIREDALYLLDEPENSLSAPKQLELKDYIENSARFFHCQFVISTHSPFLLAMPHATIYDLDQAPVRKRLWTELENVRLYHDFFLAQQHEFEN